jgi:adenine C2-methylase RlmN of 23S rRNA A2503 and tRNA A37
MFNNTTDKIDELKKITEMLHGLESKGIIEIRDRDDYDYFFWKSFIRLSKNKLILSGKTLNRWLDQNLKEDFTYTLRRLVSQEASSVSLVIYKDPDNETAEKEKLRRFLEDEIFEHCKNKSSLCIYEVDNLPYLFSSNEEHIMIGTYFANVSNVKNLLFILKADCTYGYSCINDFNYIIEKAEKNNWYHEYSLRNKEVVIKKECHIENQYVTKDWNREKTNKYLCKIDNDISEVGVYYHYKDDDLVKRVVELPTSYGCAMKCKYCAASNIENAYPLSHITMMKLLETVYEKESIGKEEKVLIVLTGTGDLFFTIDNTEEFIAEANRKYASLSFTVSSCYWTERILQRIEKLAKNIRFKNIQWTYISSDQEKLCQLIPFYSHVSENFNCIIDCIKKSEPSIYRINYLMIKDVNDSDEDFNIFINKFVSIKDKIIIRISKLNQTGSTQKNNLLPSEITQMQKFKERLEAGGFSAYLFYSLKNDNLNCGQLVSENGRS